jgi:hypothetical protein
MNNTNTNKTTSKKLDVNFERTCSCPDNRLNCLEPKEWVKSQVAIWDKRKLVNKVGIFGYPSNYITFSVTFEYILDFVRTA